MTKAAGKCCSSVFFSIFREYMALSARAITSVGLSKRRSIVNPAEAPTELTSVAKHIFMASIFSSRDCGLSPGVALAQIPEKYGEFIPAKTRNGVRGAASLDDRFSHGL